MYVIAADGAVRATLSPFALTAVDLAGVLDAPTQAPPGLYDRLRLLCYGYDPATGIYTPRIAMLLRVAAAIGVILLGSSVLLLIRAGKRAR